MRPWALLALVALLAPAALAGGGIGQGPPHDHFPAARATDVLLRAFVDETENHGASLDANEPTPCGIGATLWYALNLTGGGAGPVTADTAGSVADAALAVYAGHEDARLRDLRLVACSDDAEGHGTDARVTFDADPRLRYFVQLGGGKGDVGPLRLHLHGLTPAILPPHPREDDPI